MQKILIVFLVLISLNSFSDDEVCEKLINTNDVKDVTLSKCTDTDKTGIEIDYSISKLTKKENQKTLDQKISFEHASLKDFINTLKEVSQGTKASGQVIEKNDDDRIIISKNNQEISIIEDSKEILISNDEALKIIDALSKNL